MASTNHETRQTTHVFYACSCIPDFHANDVLEHGIEVVPSIRCRPSAPLGLIVCAYGTNCRRTIKLKKKFKSYHKGTNCCQTIKLRKKLKVTTKG
jgi:hypothetical protein